MKNKPSLYTKVLIGGNKKEILTHNLHKYKHKKKFHAQKTRRCAENERKDVQKQRKSKADIAKQKRHLPPICLKKVH